MTIAIVNEQTGMISRPYWTEDGVRTYDLPDIEPGKGLTSRILASGQPLRIGSIDEAVPLGAILEGNPDDIKQSYLGVPIPAGDRMIGVLSIAKGPVDAFTEADEQLVSTIAASMGVALENARLFDETKRLLTETNERAAELAIINSVQQGLAEKLDMQSMYELVGEKIQEIFDAQVVDIGLFNLETGMIHYPFAIERGVRYPDEPVPIGGTSKQVLDTREPVVNNDVELEAGDVDQMVGSGEPAKSFVYVPLIASNRVFGRISLQNLDRKNAFADADVRLLTTLASSLSVALENARLFDETQRLLTETNERAAELAIINSVQEGLAAKLDMQSMYELVGEKIQEIFDAQVVDIGLFDLDANQIRYPYAIERGVRYPDEQQESPRNARAGGDQRCRSGRSRPRDGHPGRNAKGAGLRAFAGLRPGLRAYLASEPRSSERVQRRRRSTADDPRRQPECCVGERAAVR
jgi:GAF domain-containing protein